MKLFDLNTLSKEELNSLPEELKRETRKVSQIDRVFDIIQNAQPAATVAYIRARYYLTHQKIIKMNTLRFALSSLSKKGLILSLGKSVYALNKVK